MKRRILLGVALVLVLGGAWFLYEQLSFPMPSASDGAKIGSADTMPSASQADVAPPVQDIIDFRMLDLDSGWYRYADGTTMVTEDGGVQWQEAGPGWREPVATGDKETDYIEFSLARQSTIMADRSR